MKYPEDVYDPEDFKPGDLVCVWNNPTGPPNHFHFRLDHPPNAVVLAVETINVLEDDYLWVYYRGRKVPAFSIFKSEMEKYP